MVCLVPETHNLNSKVAGVLTALVVPETIFPTFKKVDEPVSPFLELPPVWLLEELFNEESTGFVQPHQHNAEQHLTPASREHRVLDQMHDAASDAEIKLPKSCPASRAPPMA